jgi:hypothetical protein
VHDNLVGMLRNEIIQKKIYDRFRGKDPNVGFAHNPVLLGFLKRILSSFANSFKHPPGPLDAFIIKNYIYCNSLVE